MTENGKTRRSHKAGNKGPQANVPGSNDVRKNDPGVAQLATNAPPERAVVFQTWGSSSPDVDPSAGSGDVVECADNADTSEQNRRRPIDKPQRDEGDKMSETHVDKGQQTGEVGQEEEEHDEKSAGRWLSVHAGRDVYVSSGEVEKKGEEGQKKDEQGQKKGEDGHKKGEQVQQEQGKQQESGEASNNNKQGEGQQEREKSKKQSDDDHAEEGQKRHKQHDHPRGGNKKEKLKRSMPRWPTVVMVCVLSLVFGVGGAWGYSALFGSSKSDEKGKSSDKGGKGGGSKSGGSSGSDSDQSSEVKELKKNLGDLDDGIKQLTARMDRLTESLVESRLPIPEYVSGTSRIAHMSSPGGEESPPILPNALPTQLNVLQRKVEQMSDLSARVHALEEAVPVLQEEIKMLGAKRTEP